MGSAPHKHYALTDLEWLVVPPLASGQFMLAHGQSRETGLTAPAAVILWASVSEEVDQRLTATIDQPLRLKPHEWKSGDILWIVAAAGEPRAVMAVLEQQRQAGFNGRQIKFRLVDEKGVKVEVIAPWPADATAATSERASS